MAQSEDLVQETNYCINCKHVANRQPWGEQEIYTCHKQISIVTGRSESIDCIFERGAFGFCGKEGKYYEAK